MGANGKLKIGMYWASSCGGCDISLLEIGPRLLDLIAIADVVFWPCAADFKYKDVAAYPDGYIDACFYNGGVRNSEQEEVARLLHRSFEKQGIAIHTGTKAENIKVGKNSVTLDLVKGDQRQGLEVETVIVAIGVVANLDGALSPKVKLDLDRGFLKVDENYQTNVKGIYAAGDIIGPPWLAHVAMFRAVNAVNGMFGHGRPHHEKNAPGCTYCQPQIASIGLTEQAAKEKGVAYKIGRFPFIAAGKAVAAADSEGFVKVLADPATGEILGAHIIGAEATELISEYSLAMTLEATVDEIHATIHPHPTLGEAVMEAAAAATGEAIHI